VWLSVQYSKGVVMLVGCEGVMGGGVVMSVGLVKVLNRSEQSGILWGLEGLVSSIIGGGEGIVLGLQGYEGGCGYVYNGYQW